MYLDENELKVLISEEDYNKVWQLSQKHQRELILQTNYYFDTKDFLLFKNSATLRIREKDGQYAVNIKINNTVQSNESIKESVEYKYKIDKETFLKLIKNEISFDCLNNETTKLLNKYVSNIQEITHVGKLYTERIRFCPEDNLPPLELDKSLILDITDYELEWEINKYEEIELMKQWLKDMEIPFNKSPYGKYKRLVRMLMQL